MKKIIALFLACLMVLSLSVTGFADTAVLFEEDKIYSSSEEISGKDLIDFLLTAFPESEWENLAKADAKSKLNLKYLQSMEVSITEDAKFELNNDTLTGTDIFQLEEVENRITVSFPYHVDYSYKTSILSWSSKKGSTDYTFTGEKEFIFEIREPSKIIISKKIANAVWGNNLTEESILSQIRPVVTLESGTNIEGATVTIAEDIEKFDAGTYPVTLRYAGKEKEDGNPGIMPCEETATLVIWKAGSSVNVESGTYTYDTKEHFINVTTTPEMPYTAITVGIQGDAEGFASIYMSEGNAIYNALIFLRNSGDALNWFAKLLGIDLSNFIVGSEGVSLAQLRGVLERLGELNDLLKMGGVSVDQSELTGILDALIAIEKVLPDLNVRFYIGNMPKNQGLYLTYAVASDENHNTAIDFGYTTIVPTLDVKLEWNKENITLNSESVNTYDFSANLLEKETGNKIDSEISYKFTGLTSAGKIFSGDGLENHPTEPGVYTESAYSLYNYVATKSRTITIERDKAVVKFIDENGGAVNTLSTTTKYGGSSKSVTAAVFDDKGERIEDAKVTYTYSGKTEAGKTYLSSKPPVDSGKYTVTASFAGNEYYSPALNSGANLTIDKAKASITFDNVTIKVFKSVDISNVGYNYSVMGEEEAKAIADTLKSPFKTFILIGNYKMKYEIPEEIAANYDVTVNGGKITVKLFG